MPGRRGRHPGCRRCWSGCLRWPRSRPGLRPGCRSRHSPCRRQHQRRDEQEGHPAHDPPNRLGPDKGGTLFKKQQQKKKKKSNSTKTLYPTAHKGPEASRARPWQRMSQGPDLSADRQQRSHSALRRTTAPRLASSLNRTDAVTRRAGEGLVNWGGWHGMQGVRGSGPTSLPPHSAGLSAWSVGPIQPMEFRGVRRPLAGRAGGG